MFDLSNLEAITERYSAEEMLFKLIYKNISQKFQF